MLLPREPNFFGSFSVTTHSGPWPYLQRVPLVFYGPGHIRNRGPIEIDREVTLADVAPTLAEILDVDLPGERPGRSLTEILPPDSNRPPPQLLFVIVWDGGGWNVLNRWPDAWPTLQRLMDEGASITNATVGSSPSVTPAVHATLGTGAFPEQHGIVDIPLRDGIKVVGSFEGDSPSYLELSTLADEHDLQSGNEALVGMLAERNWHIGMMGHGSFLEGADSDIAVLLKNDRLEFTTLHDYYDLPGYLDEIRGLKAAARRVDREDGAPDGAWLGHEVFDGPEKITDSPAWTIHQTTLIKELIEREGFGADAVPDVLFTNYKQIDEVGHIHNMVNPEMDSVLSYSDEALGELVDYLDRRVGPQRWVLVVTADHGQGPDPRSVGAWPLSLEELLLDVATHFRVQVTELFQSQRPTGLWLNADTLTRRGITDQEIADFLTRYRLRDNLAEGRRLPQQYEERRNEKLFAAVFPYNQISNIWTCAASKG